MAYAAYVFCNQCGHRNPPERNFCSSCGAALDLDRDDRTIVFHPVDPQQDAPGPTDDVVVNLAELPAGWRRRSLVRSGAAGRHPARAERAASRRSAATPTATSCSTTSRCPAATRRSSTWRRGYVVRDVGSLNGTYVNAERIERDAALHHGDELQVGKFRLVFFDRTGRGVSGRVVDARPRPTCRSVRCSGCSTTSSPT